MTDERTGINHNYTKRNGVEHSEIIVPVGSPNWANNPSTLWNKVEESEVRKNSTVAREFEISLPHELDKDQRLKLAKSLSQNLVDRFGFATQFSIHHPDEVSKNFHVHILASTRKLEANGFTEKTRELDEMKKTKEQEANPAILEVRKMVADTINNHLEKAGKQSRVDHRSLNDQYLEAEKNNDAVKMVELSREPTKHIGKKPDESNRALIENKAIKQQHQNNIISMEKTIEKMTKPAIQNKPSIKIESKNIFEKLIDGITEKYQAWQKTKSDKLELEEKNRLKAERIQEENFNLERAQQWEKGYNKLAGEIKVKHEHKNANEKTLVDYMKMNPEPTPDSSAPATRKLKL